MNDLPSTSDKVVLLLVPALAIIEGLCVVSLFWRDGLQMNALAMSMALPIVLGVVAAPGYASLVLRRPNLGPVGATRRLWHWASAIAGLIASIIGTIDGLFVLPLVVLPFGSLCCCGKALLMLTESRPRN